MSKELGRFYMWYSLVLSSLFFRLSGRVRRVSDFLYLPVSVKSRAENLQSQWLALENNNRVRCLFGKNEKILFIFLSTLACLTLCVSWLTTK
jgi:hypothetical protein